MSAQLTHSQPSSRPWEAFLCTLDAGMRVKLTLVLISDGVNVKGSPPAGAGEISLIENWVCRQVFPVKQLSLTRADARPEAFLDRLRCALDGIIHLEVPHGLSIEDRVADLVNAILGVPSDFALMIFGYGAVEAQSVHSLMGRLLDYQPPPDAYLHDHPGGPAVAQPATFEGAARGIGDDFAWGLMGWFL